MIAGGDYYIGMISELYNIVPISNIQSILEYGLLSHNRIRALPHEDISDKTVQARRENKTIPNIGTKLHDYANLYICARNPMMYSRKDNINSICVLRIDKAVLELDSVVISDRNASSDYCRYYNVQEGLKFLDFDSIFADDWRHPGNPYAYYEHKSMKCAEILVPNLVQSGFINGAFVGNRVAHREMRSKYPDIDVSVNTHMFFL